MDFGFAQVEEVMDDVEKLKDAALATCASLSAVVATHAGGCGETDSDGCSSASSSSSGEYRSSQKRIIVTQLV